MSGLFRVSQPLPAVDMDEQVDSTVSGGGGGGGGDKFTNWPQINTHEYQVYFTMGSNFFFTVYH